MVSFSFKNSSWIFSSEKKNSFSFNYVEHFAIFKTSNIKLEKNNILQSKKLNVDPEDQRTTADKHQTNGNTKSRSESKYIWRKQTQWVVNSNRVLCTTEITMGSFLGRYKATLGKMLWVLPGTSGSDLLILGTWEAKIRRILVRGQPSQQKQDPISKIPNTHTKKDRWEWLKW
jgi:hypothetical protein